YPEDWVALEHPGIDHGGDSIAGVALAVGEVHNILHSVVGVCAWSPAISAYMQAERHIQVLGRGPKRLVHGMIIAMFHGSQRYHGSGQPDIGGATQLADGNWGLVHIEHGDASEALRVGFAKVS